MTVMISFKNFNEILKALELGYNKIQGCWFPRFWDRQLSGEKAQAYTKLLRMIEHDVTEAFDNGNTSRARMVWDIYIRCIDIIEFFPEEKSSDLEHVKALFNEYVKAYYPEEAEVMI